MPIPSPHNWSSRTTGATPAARLRAGSSAPSPSLLAGLLLALALFFASPAPVAAQVPGPPAAASPFLPPAHWVVDAVRTLHAAGLAPAGVDRGSRTLTRLEAAQALRTALERAAREAPHLEPLTRALLGRLRAEFPELDARLDGARPGLVITSGWADASYETVRGRAEPGRYEGYTEEDWTGPTPLPDRTGSSAALHLSADLFPHLALAVTPARAEDDWGVESAYLTGTWSGLGGWAGRRTSGFGAGGGRGVVLNPVAAFDGGGLFLPRPLGLPGILSRLGTVRGELFLSRLDSNGPVENVWFLGTRGSLTPHPRLGLGISRAAMFGGADSGLRLQDVAYILVGGHAEGSEHDNQVAALDLWWRPPTGPLPLLASVEWGFDDSAGAIIDVPGFVAALEAPTLPGLPEVALRVEHARFAGSCCGNPPWYRHRLGFHDGWTTDGMLLGHRLGGQGNEWLGEARAALAGARVLLTAQAFRRTRGPENLFEPDREGTSAGGALAANLQLRPGTVILLEGLLERGEADWSSSSARVTARLHF